MNHFLERTRRKNLVMDAALLSRLEEEAAQVKRPVSEVIQGRIRASYDAEIGEEARIWEALHQLQRDMAQVCQGQARLMRWLESLGVLGDEAAGTDTPAEGTPAEPTPKAEPTTAEFYAQVIPQGTPPATTVARNETGPRQGWWFRRAT